MMFTIDNTPKNSSYLRKGLNKLRSSTRKSPCKGTKTSNAQNRGQENVPTMNTHTAVGRAGRKGKSPQLSPKGRKNSLWATSSRTKSPRLTASACKVNSYGHSSSLTFAKGWPVCSLKVALSIFITRLYR